MQDDRNDLDGPERELGRSTLALSVAALILLVGFYILVAGNSALDTFRELAKNIIANLIPVLVVVVITITLLRKTVENRRRRDLQRLRRDIASDLRAEGG